MAGVLALGLGLRLWGIGFGLPNTLARPDEEMVVSIAVGFFKGDFNPHNFFYGTFYMYVLFAVYAVRTLFLRAAGVAKPPRHMAEGFVLAPKIGAKVPPRGGAVPDDLYYWRRWSPVAMIPEGVHRMAPTSRDPSHGGIGSAMVVLDRAGAVRYRGWIDNERLPGDPDREPWLEEALADLVTGRDVARAATPTWGCTITRSLGGHGRCAPPPAEVVGRR